MDKKEINSYCHNGGGVCVYRKRIKKAQFVVQSISIHRDTYTSYYIAVKFDPLDMVGRGEGIRWGAKSDNLDFIIESLERFIKNPMSEWTNYTRMGLQPFYDSESVTSEHYQNSWNVLVEQYKDGKLLLPKGLQFKLQTPDLVTLNYQSKYQRPNKKKKNADDLA
jgi:hypothetical protein